MQKELSIADIYHEHIGSESFWEEADEILAEYFDDSIDHEVAKRMVWYAVRIFVGVD